MIVEALFRADGQVAGACAIKALGYGLDESGVAAVNGIIFIPKVEGGRFVSEHKTVSVKFDLISVL
ncbi:MAG TPA: hypothetical protein VFC63_10240 [Blastocatellia bacterium]|nr:hypothetical protein [Blastocatellia bacterium]